MKYQQLKVQFHFPHHCRRELASKDYYCLRVTHTQTHIYYLNFEK